MQFGINPATPEKIAFELAFYGCGELRDYLTHLFTCHVGSKEWSEATEEWKDNCIIAHRVLMRSLEAVQEWDLKRKPEPVA